MNAVVIKPGAYMICDVVYVSPKGDYVIGAWICDRQATAMFHMLAGSNIAAGNGGEPEFVGGAMPLPEKGDRLVGIIGETKKGFRASAWGSFKEFVDTLSKANPANANKSTAPVVTSENASSPASTAAPAPKQAAPQTIAPATPVANQVDKFNAKHRRRQGNGKVINFPSSEADTSLGKAMEG